MTQAIQKQVLDAFKFRSATRAYDPIRKVSHEVMDYILELARLSPSSVGSEPWQFVVVQSPELRQALKPFCWGMENTIENASFVVFLLAKKNARFDSPDFVNVLKQRGLSDEELQTTIEIYHTFQRDFIKVLDNDRTLFDWASKQTYIALANMLIGAAMIGVDSCPIEGFDYDKVNQILAEHGVFDPNEYGVSVAVTFGYRAKEISQKSRKSSEQVIKWVE